MKPGLWQSGEMNWVVRLVQDGGCDMIGVNRIISEVHIHSNIN